MAYTADDVKRLREVTAAGMLECKKALDESGGDFEKAIDRKSTRLNSSHVSESRMPSSA